MKNKVNKIKVSIALGIIIFLIGCADNPKKTIEPETLIETKEPDWTQDQEDVKATVEHFLVVAGNYDLEAMDDMILEKANLGISSFRDSIWTPNTMTIDGYFNYAKTLELSPYFEPVTKWIIHVNKGQLAFVWADAILHKYGVRR